MSGIALILAGHGSHVSANTAGIVWSYVDELRQMGIADEVAACFWKEPPAFSQAFNTVEAEDVVVVPLFTARGYFTQDVLPREMGLSGALTQKSGRRIHLTPCIGDHPILDDIVDERLRALAAGYRLPPAETAVAVIGHGTARNRNSRDAARQQAERLRGSAPYNEVVAVYLDDEPDIPSVYHSTQSPNIIALPYFLAEGSHVNGDVPRALGINGEQRAQPIEGRAVYYCDPVGSDETIIRVILSLARDTGLPFAPRSVSGAWTGFPSAGKRALIEALETERILRFGELQISRQRVWREAQGESRAIESPAELRRRLRETPFRPLPTSKNLPGGWHVDLEAKQDAHAVVETVYPGLVADWAAQLTGRFPSVSLEAVSKRQVGMFKDIHKLRTVDIKRTIDEVCGVCIRQPTWWRGAAAAKDGLPCREACNLWLSSARKRGEAS